MKRVRIAELKDHLSRHLRSVERGEEIEVLDRDRPIARIVPSVGARMLIPAFRPAPLALRRKRYPRARLEVSSLELLLEDRRKR